MPPELESELVKIRQDLESINSRIDSQQRQIEENFEQDRKTIGKLDRLLGNTSRKSNITVGGFLGLLLACVIAGQVILIGDSKDLIQLLSIVLGLPAVTATAGAYAKNSSSEVSKDEN